MSWTSHSEAPQHTTACTDIAPTAAHMYQWQRVLPAIHSRQHPRPSSTADSSTAHLGTSILTSTRYQHLFYDAILLLFLL